MRHLRETFFAIPDFGRLAMGLSLRAAVLMALTIAGIARAADAPPNTLTEAEKAAGWKLLFDGKTTDGWRNYQKPDIAPGWKVENGELVRGTEKAVDIVTTDKYGAFELSLEYNISPGGNSGLMYHVTEEGKQPWNTG
ncbi:MAG: DUF1080 domain-containing protein, partial [Planctomycetia bacterium]|nr:DUF1080 domain-containing protein [Planctomycetia bacterium]